MALALSASVMPLDAQGQQQPVLVIRGGTLIDGNGGAPVQNATVIVTGNRITQVGRNLRVPAGARVVEANGKWVLPGLIDAKSNWYWEYGEAALYWGVTSAMVSGGRNDVGTATRDAINHGMMIGPRLFQTYVAIGGKGPMGQLPDNYVPGEGGSRAGTSEEVVMWTKRAIEGGADFITYGDGNGPANIWQEGIREAERAGKAIVYRAMGPQTRAKEVCAMGNGIVYVHTGNVGAQIARDETKWATYTGLPPDPFSEMDDAKARAAIQQLVRCNAYLEPDLMAADKGFHKNWARVMQENKEFLNDPNLKAYYPLHSYHGVIENHKSPETYLTPQQMQVRAAGFAGHTRFLKMFVDAGGKIVAASDNPQSHPGLGMHQEMTAFVEDVGLTPMQGILSGTKWVAEGFKTPDLGVIAQGKLADIIIVNANPLQDIKNLRQIDTVILDGKVVDRTYHPNYNGHIFTNSRDNNEWSIVGDEGWASALKEATWNPNARNGGFGGAGGIDSEKSPTPGIEKIMPYVAKQGSQATEVTITGFNFVRRSQVLVNGQPVPASVVSRTEIKAMVPANAFANAGKQKIEVKNPTPLAAARWGDTSNPAFVLVPYSFTTAGSWNRW
jgi:imidazolonepropionase-like amidohydrolase